MPDGQIRQVGVHTVLLQLHPEVELEVTVVVAQLTDMGINMPPRGGEAQAEESEEETTAAEAAEEQDETTEVDPVDAEANADTDTDKDA